MISDEIEEKGYTVKCMDGAEGMMLLPDKSIKLIYGSPPYPNADKNYGVWGIDEYIEKITPFIEAAKKKLKDDGFLVINLKANRENATSKRSSKRSLIVEKLAILLEEQWGFYCVDIEIWLKENPVPTGLRSACQDAYEQNLWFSVSPKWDINIDAIRRPYESHSIQTYSGYEYKPRSNGNTYVRKNKRIEPNPLGALPKNVIEGSVSAKIGDHQATQPLYLPEKYIKATTKEGDLVVDPWVGSGTTGAVALELGRKFAGFDIVDSYVKETEKWLSEILTGGVTGMSDMPKRLRKIDLYRILLDGLGDRVAMHSDITSTPFLVEFKEPFALKLRIYLFNCTNPPGGRALDEYKIQIILPAQKRGERGRLDFSGGYIPILCAYVSEESVFVLWDAYKHDDFAYSANMQVKADVILRAKYTEVAEMTRKNGEVVLAARPEYMYQAIRRRIEITDYAE